jgi:agmatine deiminase
MIQNTPAKQGFFFPAEWYAHKATWLSWPHKEASWPGKLESIYPQYAQFIKLIAEGEEVRINVANTAMELFARSYIEQTGANMAHIFFHHFPTNDAWCRDHGPAFLINKNPNTPKAIVDWGYNAWGDKYPPYDLDDIIPTKIAEMYNLPVFHPGIIMEGGSVEFNGEGTLLTSTSCLLNPNRNPSKSKDQIEEYLEEYYGINHILWLGEGIIGDDTDGHIDDMTRFVNKDTVVTVVEEDKSDENYFILKENLKELNSMRLENGKQLNIVELPMPSAVIYDDQRLPASYANFYISNNHVIVPTFRDKNDTIALDTLQKVFTDRKVTGLDSTDIIWGLGSFHCLSQQEPV